MIPLGLGIQINASGDPTRTLNLDFVSGVLDSRITFTRATEATYYNSSGVLSTAASGAARFDYNPVTLDAKGLLIEEARTNRCLYSADFSNAAWVKSNITVTANDATGVFGTATADLLTADAANGTVIQDLGVVASAAKTGAIYIKRKTGTGNIDLTMDGGSTWTTKAVTSTWTRFDLTQTLADEDFGIRIVTSGDEIWVEAADVQTGAFITSHIPTTSAAVTRNADVAVMTGTNFSNWYNQTEGTFYVEGTAAIDARLLLSVSNGTSNEDIQVRFRDSSQFSGVDGGVSQWLLDSGNVVENTFSKIAAAYKLNDIAVSLDGNAVATDTSATIPTPDRMHFGSDVGAAGTHINGHIKTMRYYNTRKTNAELVSLTS